MYCRSRTGSIRWTRTASSWSAAASIASITVTGSALATPTMSSAPGWMWSMTAVAATRRSSNSLSTPGRMLRRSPNLLVPADDDGLVVLVAERAQRAGPKPEQAAILRRQLHPARADDAKGVPVPEEDAVPSSLAALRDHPVGARAHVGRTLTV